MSLDTVPPPSCSFITYGNKMFDLALNKLLCFCAELKHVLVVILNWADLVAHAIMADHALRHLGGLDNIAVGAAGDVFWSKDKLFCDTTSKTDVQLGKELAPRKRVLLAPTC